MKRIFKIILGVTLISPVFIMAGAAIVFKAGWLALFYVFGLTIVLTIGCVLGCILLASIH